jgi:hypothetical protein
MFHVNESPGPAPPDAAPRAKPPAPEVSGAWPLALGKVPGADCSAQGLASAGKASFRPVSGKASLVTPVTSTEGKEHYLSNHGEREFLLRENKKPKQIEQRE